CKSTRRTTTIPPSTRRKTAIAWSVCPPSFSSEAMDGSAPASPSSSRPPTCSKRCNRWIEYSGTLQRRAPQPESAGTALEESDHAAATRDCNRALTGIHAGGRRGERLSQRLEGRTERLHADRVFGRPFGPHNQPAPVRQTSDRGGDGGAA